MEYAAHSQHCCRESTGNEYAVQSQHGGRQLRRQQAQRQHGVSRQTATQYWTPDIVKSQLHMPGRMPEQPWP